MMKTVNSLIEQLYSYATNGGYLKPSHRAKYTCEFNITQYGDTCDDTRDTPDTGGGAAAAPAGERARPPEPGLHRAHGERRAAAAAHGQSLGNQVSTNQSL